MSSGKVKGVDRCQDCGDPPEEDRRRCKPCAKAHSATEAERRAARKKARLCVVCGAAASTTKIVRPGTKPTLAQATLCKRHLKYYAERRG